MDKRVYAIEYFRRSEAVFRAYVDENMPGLTELVEATIGTFRRGGKVLLFGNGGSAADAQHLAAELVNRYLIKDRAALAAIALTTDTSALTSVANDIGWQHVFSRQVEALAHSGDLALGLSTSGNSENVLAGLRAAKDKDCVTAGFCGRDPGKMKNLCDLLIQAPDDLTPVVQQFHGAVGHLWVDLVEKGLQGE